MADDDVTLDALVAKAGDATDDELDALAAQLADEEAAEELSAWKKQEWTDELVEELAAAAQEAGRTNAQRGFAYGGSFVLDLPEHLPVIWGTEAAPLAIEGEGLMIAGIQGVGKTSVAQQLVLGLVGQRDEVLGLPVVPAAGKVLYLAMDRPLQIARSWARMVSEQDRELLNERVIVWRGPLPFTLTEKPKALATWARDQIGAACIVVDSYKDIAPDLSSEATGARINEAMQECLAEGIGWIGLHHNRKASADNPAPKSLADVYGSNWLTAGVGSVLYLYGEPGSELVEAIHLKQPAESLGTFGVRHDHEAGLSERVGELPEQGKKAERQRRIVELLSAKPGHPFDADEIAQALPGKKKMNSRTIRRDMEDLSTRSDIEQIKALGVATGKWQACPGQNAPLGGEGFVQTP